MSKSNGGHVCCGLHFCADLARQCDASCDLCGDGSNAPPPEDEPLLLCFDIVCHAPTIAGQGVVPEIGTCTPGGALDSVCRFSCSEGSTALRVAEGLCLPLWYARDEVAVAQYVGQNVTCTPERNQDGSLGERYCRIERIQALRSCCASMPGGASGTACGPESLPETCSLACAELWL
eukprot:SAG22_NODE_3180_length_1873_cov_1.251973_4_plen_176_part_01